MPYRNLAELPETVSDHLPDHAQEIFLAAFNNAYDEYGHDEHRAFAVAWGAVENSYAKNPKTGTWEKIKK
jgi:cation transport regulator